MRNPATRFFEWSSDDKTLKWYDKETKENTLVKLPFVFLVLDQLNTVGGWSDADQSGIWSNEVRNTRTDILTVRTKLGIKREGVYENVKTVPGAKYVKSVYIAYKGDSGDLELGHLKLKGSAGSAWIEFTKKRNVYDGAFKIVKADGPFTKGKTEYWTPVFEANSVTPETSEKADELDRQLQSYLKVYLAQPGERAMTATATNGAYFDDEPHTAEPDEPAFAVTPPPPDFDDGIPF